VKILHVTRGMLNSAGTTHVVKSLAEEQARRGADVSLWLCEQSGPPPMLPDQALVDARIFQTSVPLYHPGISLGFARAAKRSIADFDFVHVHGVWNFPSWWSMRTAIHAGVPFMVAPHGSFEPWAMRRNGRRKGIYAREVELPLMNRAWAIHALSLTERDQVKALGLAAPVEVLPNGVDLSWFGCAGLDLRRFGVPAETRTLLSLSRLHPKKGIDVLIRGFAQFAKVVPNVHLLIAGSDQNDGYAGILRDLVNTNELGARVQFIGEIFAPAKYELLRAVDAFPLISHSEGLPIAVLEAMGASLPVIITPGCNLPEVATSGAGLVVDPDASEVTRALHAVFGDGAAAARMITAARRTIETHFTWRQIADQSLALYSRAAASRCT
jgi:poly(glycerol-phosphate) alpha-glucosyltransferase